MDQTNTPLRTCCQEDSSDLKEHVVLVNDSDWAIGTAPKLEAHELGLLHRAFSIFVVNSSGQILMQRRSAMKYHSPGLWSNTCCGHPKRTEVIESAAHRRPQEEMGIDCNLRRVGVLRYRIAVGRGLTEHEIDHLFVGVSDGVPAPNPTEVGQWALVSPQLLAEHLAAKPHEFSGWLASAFARVRIHLTPLPDKIS